MKKGIIKKTVMLGLGLVLVTGLVACSDKKDDQKTTSTDKKEIVSGIYDIPEDAGTIRVKITDLLSESLEMEVE